MNPVWNRFRPAAVLAALIATAATDASAQQPAAQTAPIGTTAGVRLAYDDNYVYAAWSVDDSRLIATARGVSPGTWPAIAKDDSVALHVAIGERRIALVVSAAGAYAWLADGKPAPFFGMKFAPTVRGSLDRIDDIDKGFDVEQAIPWSALGLPTGSSPAAGTPVRFCLVVHKYGSDPVLQPASATIDNPSTWFVAGDATSPVAWTKRTAAPTIDGRIDRLEWTESEHRFPVPDPVPSQTLPILPLIISPMLESDTTLPVGTGADDTLAAQRHVFARFRVAVNADLLKRTAPTRDVLDPQGVFTPVDHPAIGYGPWTSYDRTGWQRLQLTGMAQAGIDTAWTVVVPSGNPFEPFDTKALTVLAAAHRELVREGEGVPRLAPCIEAPLGSAPIDLAASGGRERLFQSLRRWLETVPPSQWSRVRVPGATGTVPAVPVLLSGADGWTNVESDWAQALRLRLSTELGARLAGATIWFVIDDNFPSASVADARVGADLSGLAVRQVRPGSQAPFVPRRFGETYKNAWESAKDAHWVVVDSWNDFNAATEIAPSRQYGEGYVGLTRLFRTTLPSTRFAQTPVHIEETDLPRRARGGQLFPIDIPVRNTGSRPLAAADIQLSYRWLRGGTVVAEGANTGQPAGPLAPGLVVSVRLAIATVGAGAQPLAPGDYQLEITARHPAGTVRRLRPVRIADTDSVEIASTTLPPLVQAGGALPVRVALRLCAAEAIAAGKARLVWQIVDNAGVRVLAAGQEVPDRPIPAGTWVSIPTIVRTTTADGAPIEPAFPEQRAQEGGGPLPGTHRIRWVLLREDGSRIDGGLDESLVVYPPIDTVRVEAVTLGAGKTPAADSPLRVSMRVTNTSPRRWEKGQIGLTGRWFQTDGFPLGMVVALPTTSIDVPLAAGETREMVIDVRTPMRAGRYVLGVLALRPPDQFLALSPLTGTSDSAFVPVDIEGGRAVAVDLASHWDTDAVSWEPLPRDGDLDGSGSTLPGEWFPADRFGAGAGAAVYPSGYYTDIASDIIRSAVFRFGPTEDGKRNAVAARQQRITLPKGKYVALHAAAVSTTAPTELVLTLVYTNGKTETVRRKVRAWRDPVQSDEALALRVPRRRAPGGDVAESLALQHLVLPVSPGMDLAAVVLPNTPEVKVFAITLER